MSIQIYAERPDGNRLSPEMLRDFAIANASVIAMVGTAWGSIDEGYLGGHPPCAAVCEMMPARIGNGDDWDVWPADQVQVGVLRAREEYAAMRDRGDFADRDKHSAYASALAIIAAAAEHNLQLRVSI